MGRAASFRRQKLQNRVIFPDFSAFQMTVDAVPLPPDPSGGESASGGEGASGGASGGSAPRPRRQDALGADAWPGFTPEAARRP